MVVRHTWHSSIPLALVWFDQQDWCLYLQSKHCQIVWYLCRICTYIPVLCPLSFSVWVSLFSFSQLRGSVPFALHWCSGTGVEYLHVSLLEVWISVATDVSFTSSYEWKVYRRIVKKKRVYRLSQLWSLRSELSQISDFHLYPNLNIFLCLCGLQNTLEFIFHSKLLVWFKKSSILPFLFHFIFFCGLQNLSGPKFWILLPSLYYISLKCGLNNPMFWMGNLCFTTYVLVFVVNHFVLKFLVPFFLATFLWV